MFSSDFPHEVNLQTINKEIRELREREGLAFELRLIPREIWRGSWQTGSRRCW